MFTGLCSKSAHPTAFFRFNTEAQRRRGLEGECPHEPPSAVQKDGFIAERREQASGLSGGACAAHLSVERLKLSEKTLCPLCSLWFPKGRAMPSKNICGICGLETPKPAPPSPRCKLFDFALTLLKNAIVRISFFCDTHTVFDWKSFKTG